MPSSRSRRACLRGSVAAALAGLAGCVVGTDSPSDGDAYSVSVINTITVADVSNARNVDPPISSSVDVAVVEPVKFEDDTVVFEQTVELALGESRTMEDAFTPKDDQTYELEVDLTPWEGMDVPQDVTRGTLRFRPGQFNDPEDQVLKVEIVDISDTEFVIPGIAFQTGGSERIR